MNQNQHGITTDNSEVPAQKPIKTRSAALAMKEAERIQKVAQQQELNPNEIIQSQVYSQDKPLVLNEYNPIVTTQGEHNGQLSITCFRLLFKGQYFDYQECLKLRLISRQFNYFICEQQQEIKCDQNAVTMDIFQILLNIFPNAKTIQFTNVFVKSLTQLKFPHAENITRFTFRYLEPNKEEFDAFISQFPNLRAISLNYLKTIATSDPTTIQPNTSIQELKLDKVYNVNNLGFFQEFQQLTAFSLQVHESQNFFELYSQLDPAIKPRFKKFGCRFWGPTIKQEQLKYFHEFMQQQQQLEVLSIDLCVFNKESRLDILKVLSKCNYTSIDQQPGIKQLHLQSLKVSELEIFQEVLQLNLLILEFDFMYEVWDIAKFQDFIRAYIPLVKVIDLSRIEHKTKEIRESIEDIVNNQNEEFITNCDIYILCDQVNDIVHTKQQDIKSNQIQRNHIVRIHNVDPIKKLL